MADITSALQRILSDVWRNIIAAILIPTKRLGLELQLAVSLEVATLAEARALERQCKLKQNPQLALHLLRQRGAMLNQ